MRTIISLWAAILSALMPAHRTAVPTGPAPEPPRAAVVSTSTAAVESNDAPPTATDAPAAAPKGAAKAPRASKPVPVQDPAAVPQAPAETRDGLISKFTSLRTDVELTIQNTGLPSNDPKNSDLSYMDGKITSDLANLGQDPDLRPELDYYASQYAALSAEYARVPPVVSSVLASPVASDLFVSGQGFSAAASVYIVKANPSATDLPIDLPFMLESDWKIDAKPDSYIAAGQYDLYVRNASGATSAAYPVYIQTADTREGEQTGSANAVNTSDCRDAQDKLNVAIQNVRDYGNPPSPSLASIEQNYIRQVGLLCQ